MFNTYF